MLNSREKKILIALKEAKKPLTISNLSAITGVTTRTVKKDIEILKQKLDRNKVEIITKPGVGVWIEEKVDDEYLENVLYSSNKIINPIFPDDRVYYIAKRLLETNNLMTLEDFSVELYVSKSTVAKDILKVEEFLGKYGIKLYKKPKHGIKVIGDEKSIRLANAEILKNVTTKHDEIINDSLKDLLKDVDLNAIQRIIQGSEEKFNYILSDVSFKGLLIHLAISIKRLWEGKKVTLDLKDLNLLKKEKEWEIAKDLAKNIEKRFNVVVDDTEIGYITMHLMGAKLQNDIETEKFSENYLKRLDCKLYIILKSIVNDIAEMTGYKFYNDKKLLVGLFLHLKPTINRLKNGVKLDNPFLEEIKKECGIAFEISISFWEKLKEFYKINVNEDEIGYVAIHFGASIERLKSVDRNKKTAVIVCATGIGTAQLLTARLTKLFPNIELIKVLPVIKAKSMLKDLSPDIVLSTVPFETEEAVVINVSPFLDEEDVDKIERIVKNKKIDTEVKKIKSKILNYISEDLVFLKIKAKDKFEVLFKMSQRLLALNYVKEGFYESVLQRDSFSSTAVGNLVAIPHPYEGFVNLPKISVATLKSPIKWDDDKKVQIVFMIALDLSIKEEFKNIFDELAEAINDKEKILKLVDCKDYREFIETFKA
ncbi:PTS modulated transcriptional regulator, MtlR family [Thermoanaerobacter italicus Ab9]|uniref:PTS modulated transcriptional regulator, MtlR family n=1 Tax=Thermoanaerobacter italicus (strain DSM 9252 / Ab9) TaxID=580331 RepID=D3T793_THEIA|nr:BglG family transcription antiterminator [Thermoanaerobacter italicus]ADD01825.1 PTS modulated transcriptional regulator, MtlR family [Thermoanaerobacter italicus Ab9]